MSRARDRLVESQIKKIERAGPSPVYTVPLEDLVMMQMTGNFDHFLRTLPNGNGKTSFDEAQRLIEETRAKVTTQKLFPSIVEKTIEAQFGEKHAALRELGQNGRDAYDLDLTRNSVVFDVKEGEECVVLRARDYGCGMDIQTLVRDLLIPYNSAKEFDSNKIGEHGIGWYSIVDLANCVRVVTKTKDSDHAVQAVIHRDRDTWKAAIQPHSKNGFSSKLNKAPQGTEIIAFIPYDKSDKNLIRDYLFQYLGFMDSWDVDIRLGDEVINSGQGDYHCSLPAVVEIDGETDELLMKVSKREMLGKLDDPRFKHRNNHLEKIVYTQNGLFVKYDSSPFEHNTIHSKLFNDLLRLGLDFWTELPKNVTLTKGRNDIIADHEIPVLAALYESFENVFIDVLLGDKDVLQHTSGRLLDTIAGIFDKSYAPVAKSLKRKEFTFRHRYATKLAKLGSAAADTISAIPPRGLELLAGPARKASHIPGGLVNLLSQPYHAARAGREKLSRTYQAVRDFNATESWEKFNNETLPRFFKQTLPRFGNRIQDTARNAACTAGNAARTAVRYAPLAVMGLAGLAMIGAETAKMYETAGFEGASLFLSSILTGTALYFTAKSTPNMLREIANTDWHSIWRRKKQEEETPLPAPMKKKIAKAKPVKDWADFEDDRSQRLNYLLRNTKKEEVQAEEQGITPLADFWAGLRNLLSSAYESFDEKHARVKGFFKEKTGLYMDVAAKKERKRIRQKESIAKKYLSEFKEDRFLKRIMHKEILSADHYYSKEEERKKRTEEKAVKKRYSLSDLFNDLRGKIPEPAQAPRDIWGTGKDLNWPEHSAWNGGSVYGVNYKKRGMDKSSVKLSIDDLIDLQLRGKLRYDKSGGQIPEHHFHHDEYFVDYSNPIVRTVVDKLENITKKMGKDYDPKVLEDHIDNIMHFAKEAAVVAYVATGPGLVHLLAKEAVLAAKEWNAKRKAGAKRTEEYKKRIKEIREQNIQKYADTLSDSMVFNFARDSMYDIKDGFFKSCGNIRKYFRRNRGKARKIAADTSIGALKLTGYGLASPFIGLYYVAMGGSMALTGLGSIGMLGMKHTVKPAILAALSILDPRKYSSYADHVKETTQEEVEAYKKRRQERQEVKREEKQERAAKKEEKRIQAERDRKRKDAELARRRELIAEERARSEKEDKPGLLERLSAWYSEKISEKVHALYKNSTAFDYMGYGSYESSHFKTLDKKRLKRIINTTQIGGEYLAFFEAVEGLDTLINTALKTPALKVYFARQWGFEDYDRAYEGTVVSPRNALKLKLEDRDVAAFMEIGSSDLDQKRVAAVKLLDTLLHQKTHQLMGGFDHKRGPGYHGKKHSNEFYETKNKMRKAFVGYLLENDIDIVDFLDMYYDKLDPENPHNFTVSTSHLGKLANMTRRRLRDERLRFDDLKAAIQTYPHLFEDGQALHEVDMGDHYEQYNTDTGKVEFQKKYQPPPLKER